MPKSHFDGMHVGDDGLEVTGAETHAGAITHNGVVTHTEPPVLAEGLLSTAQSLTPDDAEGAGVNVILPGVTAVRLAANVNGADDFVVLPALASVPNGHCVTIIAGAVGCEVHTPADSDEEINSENCDGTKEYILAATQIHHFIKIDATIGWMGHGFTAIGAVAAAIVPD